jgi:uncharacterized protein YsxB (DUF464 family)
MIKATFYKTNYNTQNNANEKELFIGFNIKGHSGYAEAGSDIVCASVSSMVMLFLNMAEGVFGVSSDSYELKMNEKNAEIDFKVKKEVISQEISQEPYGEQSIQISKGLFCLMECIESVEQDYSSFVKVKEVISKL